MDNELFELAERLGQSLKAKGHKIATAESCTGGWIAQAITEVPGSSAWFDRGFVTYSNNAKIQMLDVNPQALVEYGAVSAEVAQQMAVGALANSEADWAIAVTGIAGPDGGSEEKPVGTVYIAWQSKTGISKVKKLQLSGNRQHIREQTVIKSIEGVLIYTNPNKLLHYTPSS
ncbi:CinA family protein [Methyloglobulus sp.]|uniref:CinA family protein n=1 Tax=Methyloglobulus sp. TaxID=2518622 RepID=UPI0032B73D78